jgi:hypothetical protein
VAAALQPAVAEETMTPVAGAATLTELSGEVVVINTETRLMTLKTADGTFEVLRIPPEVERIKAIKVGDKVTISETEAVLVEIEKGRDAGAMGAVPEQSMEREEGKKPAGTMVDKLTLYGKVLDVRQGQVGGHGPGSQPDGDPQGRGPGHDRGPGARGRRDRPVRAGDHRQGRVSAPGGG